MLINTKSIFILDGKFESSFNMSILYSIILSDSYKSSSLEIDQMDGYF